MAKITWNRPTPSGTYEQIVRGVPGIGAATYAKAQSIAPVAEAIMAPHHANNAARREPGESISSISVSKGMVSDACVNLDDRDGGSIGINHHIRPLHKAAGIL